MSVHPPPLRRYWSSWHARATGCTVEGIFSYVHKNKKNITAISFHLNYNILGKSWRGDRPT